MTFHLGPDGLRASFGCTLTILVVLTGLFALIAMWPR